LMMTASEAFLLSAPNPIGPRAAQFKPACETWMGFSRIFDNVWGGKRHAMVGPTQIDRFGQANISCIGDYARPKAMMLGVRGFPGNSISHANSFFVPAHNTRVFKDGECDVVCSIGYNPARLARGYSLDEVDIRLVITDLCVMDFGGPEHQLRLRSLHPGISVEQVQQNTGFPVCVPADVATTPAPTAGQLEIIRRMDPHNLRARELKDNPPGDRTAR
ncbi:MAG: ketoacid CoA transferase, partial [Pseudomonadales bacterium]|nr:ketoacid CoA transferase [Pseudomonadales bacterium]